MNWLLFNTYLLGLWSFAIIITVGGIVPFNFWILGSFFNLIPFIYFYKKEKQKL